MTRPPPCEHTSPTPPSPPSFYQILRPSAAPPLLLPLLRRALSQQGMGATHRLCHVPPAQCKGGIPGLRLRPPTTPPPAGPAGQRKGVGSYGGGCGSRGTSPSG
eukprot:3620353-Pyramimonas_sp.AAC.1